MPTAKLTLKPGVNTQLSQTLNASGISASNLIRFRNGLPEKIGGWTHIINQHVVGSVRFMHAWTDLMGVQYLAFGSDQRLQVTSLGAVYDITPLRRTTNAATILSTTNGSPLITVTDAGHGAAVGDWVQFPIYTSIGGLIIYGFYQVSAILSSSQFQFNAGHNATSTVPAGGINPQFTTTNGSANVTVALASHTFANGDVFNLPVSTTVGGLTLFGQYLVSSVVAGTSFVITAPTTAGSNASVFENGGNVQVLYLLATGLASDTVLSGWGSGTWGSGTWGIGMATGLQLSPLRNWSLDNFGQNLEAVPTNGALYEWTPPVTIAVDPALIVTNAPTVNWAMFIAMPQEQIVLLGSSVGGVQDPLLIAWCDAGNNTVWAATATNQAGTFRLPRGSKIIGGMQGPHTALIWTDIELWSMTYIQPPFIYDFELFASGCGLIAKNAFGVLNERIFWMSQKHFFVLDSGGARALPCDVWDILFRDLNQSQLDKIFCAPNSNFSEISWFYPSAGSIEIDSYVKLNIVENTWDFGSLVRLAWIDQSVLGSPIGVDGINGLLQQHETSPDADGTPMTGVSLLTGYMDLADGNEYIFLDRLIPDFKWDGSTGVSSQRLQMMVYATAFPGDAPVAVGPFDIDSATRYVTPRVRARQIALGITSDIAGVQWRLGAVRYRGAPDGKM